MSSTIGRGVAYFSYTPLLGLAAAVTLGKLIVYAGLVDVGEFGSLGKMLLVSTVFAFGGNLGLQSVASRDLPTLLARGQARRGIRLLAQTVAVSTAVGLACALAAVAGLTLFGLTAKELLLGIMHGWAQSTFLTVSFESRSRLEMRRYARDTAMRSMAAALAGMAVGAAGGSAGWILLAEVACTLALFAAIAAAAIGRAHSSATWLLRAAATGLQSLPWKASLVLLAGAVVGFASSNLDRWIAAERLGRELFGLYSFAWLALLAALSVQSVLNSGFLPLLSRRCAESLEASAYRLTRLISSALLAGGLMLVWPMSWLACLLVERFLPQYNGAIELLTPLLLAAVLRLSDFWSSLLIVIKREGLLLAGQSAAIVLAAVGYAAWLAAAGAEPAPASLAWLAFTAALFSHSASVVSVCFILRASRQATRLTS